MPENGIARIVVAGSRAITDDYVVREAIREAPFTFRNVEVVTGGAEGVDSAAKQLASERMQLDYREFEPEWDEHGRAAGPIRNQEMAQYADALVAVWDGESSGTRNMIENALGHGLDVYVRQVDGKNTTPSTTEVDQ